MQSLQSFFSRFQTTKTTISAAQPMLLTLDDLKLVGGGLPRVSRNDVPTSNAAVEPLPRVS